MPDEFLFRVQGSKAISATPQTLEQAGLKEREDLQEWVIAHPELIGPDVRVVTFEFGKWVTGNAQQAADRLDILGLDPEGRLVVVELKRDRAPDTVEMQALKYAAMASRFTPETLAAEHARFLTGRGKVTSEEEALADLSTFAPELSIETLREPRIVLMARDFSPVVTATCVWLNEMGLDLRLVRFQAYRSEDQTLITVSQLFPVPDVEEFTISPRQAEVRQAGETKRRTHDVSAVRRLVAAGLIPDGSELTLAPRAGVNTEIRNAVEEWVKEDTARTRATWQNDASAPLTWESDGQKYSPSGLARAIIAGATGIDRPVQGTVWWVDEDGNTLVELAASLVGGRGAAYFEFWTTFLERVRLEHPDWTTARSPQTTNWMDMPGAVSGTRYSFSFGQGSRLRAELYIDTGHAHENDAIYQAFSAHETQVAAAFGGEVSFEALSEKRASRIAVYREGSIENRADWESYLDWFLDAGGRLRDALQPFVP